MTEEEVERLLLRVRATIREELAELRLELGEHQKQETKHHARVDGNLKILVKAWRDVRKHLHRLDERVAALEDEESAA